MIIDNFLQLKKYLPTIVIKGDVTAIDDYIIIAEEELTEDILSSDLYDIVIMKKDEDRKLIEKCERIVALSSFLMAIPDLDLVLTQSGFAVHNSESMSPASTARVKSLITSISERLDKARDSLIRFLLSSTLYADIWRVTVQFEKITSCIIPTYSEFKEYAPFSTPKYPNNYSEFKRLIPSLEIALMGEVSSYISRDYSLELIEKIRDNEPSTPEESEVIKLVKYAICAISLDNNAMGRTHVLKARSFMLKRPSMFPTFINSPEGQTLDSTVDNSPIFSML